MPPEKQELEGETQQHSTLIPDEAAAKLACGQHALVGGLVPGQLLPLCSQASQVAAATAASCFLPPNLPFPGAYRSCTIEINHLEIFSAQIRCFTEAEFFKKILVEMFASGIGRKRKNPHFESVKTWQKFIQMWSNALT